MNELADYESRFRRAGLPLFIEDYSAAEDVFTRAAPILSLVFIGEMFLAANKDWAVWQSAVAVLGGFAILVCAFGMLNVVRRRRFWSLPRHIGWPELAGFVLIPAILPLVFGAQLTQTAGTIGSNALLVLLVYLVVGYGLIGILLLALARIGGQLASSLTILVRALPLLLVFAVVLFVNTEMWMVFHNMPRPFLFIVGGLFVGLGTAFLVLRAPGEVREIEEEARGDGPPLSRRQRINVGLVMLVSQSVQILVVSAGMGVFFVIFGAFTISPEVQEGWDAPPDDHGQWKLPFEVFGSKVVITETLLRVSGGIAAITGLYYAIAVQTDATYRTEFLARLTGEMKKSFQLRSEYLSRREALLNSPSPSPPEPGPGREERASTDP